MNSFRLAREDDLLNAVADIAAIDARVTAVEGNIPAMSPQGAELVTESWADMRTSLSVYSKAEVDSAVGAKAATTVTDDHESRITALEGAPQGGEAFPVGSVFMSVVSTNPATLLGYGTWAAFAAGRVIVGIDSGQTEFDTVKETGGSKTVTLTAAQSGLPQHRHQVLRERSATTGGATTLIARTSDTSSTVDTNVFTENVAAQDAAEAHTNLQPYIVCYIWERTA